MANWMQGLGAGLSVLGGELSRREEEKRTKEQRAMDIRDKLSLVNAQAPEKRRVVPGKELPPDVAGPPEPEAVETFKTQLKYDPEKGYSAEDTVLGRTANQWTQTGRKVNEEGDKVYIDTTERDLAGNERTRFEEAEAAKKLRRERLLRGDQMVDVAVDDEMNIVKELGSGARHKPAGAGRSPEDVRAGIDYRDKLVRERQRESDRLMGDRAIRESTARQISDWRNMSARERGPANAALGLPENATEQQVRNAIRLRAKEDYGIPEGEPGGKAEMQELTDIVENLPKDREPAAKAEPRRSDKPDDLMKQAQAQAKKGNPIEDSEMWKNRNKPKPIDAEARKLIADAKAAGFTRQQIEDAMIEDGYDPTSL